MVTMTLFKHGHGFSNNLQSGNYPHILIIFLMWLGIILLVNPLGEFPINDDWAYAIIVKKWAEKGQFQLINWGEMSLVSHLIPATLLAKIFGFSFVLLRVTTLILSFLGLFGVYRLLLLVQPSRQIAFMAGLVVLACPVYMALSFSYMTDLPFTTFCIWAVYFFIRADLKQSGRALIYAILFTIWAMLSRQLALVIPFAWLISHWLVKRENDRSWAWKGLPFLVSLAVLLIFNKLMGDYGLLPDTYGSKLRVLKGFLQEAGLRQLRNTIGYIALFFVYMGLFLSPLLFFLRWRSIEFKQWWLIVISTVLLAGMLIATNKTIPAVDNVFINLGVGPNTMMDYFGSFRMAPPGGAAPVWLLSLITIIGAFFGTVMAVLLFNDIRERSWKLQSIESFLLVLIVCYMGPFMITGYYDRYLIFMMPLVAMLIIRWLQWEGTKTILLRAGFSFLTLFICFSTAATHDYMSYNRLRWRLIEELQTKGINNLEIGGGVEFEGWYLFDNENPTWWKRDEPRYQVRFVPGMEQETIKVVQYARWLPGENKITVTKLKP